MWLALGLRLLGIGKFLKEFFLQNWKWIVPLLLVIAGFLWTKEHYYTLGQDTERAKWDKRVEEETKRNQELSINIGEALKTYGQLFLNKENNRLQKEVTHENRIETIIKEKPIYTDCKVDQEVLNEQNALKALGPKP